MSQIVFYPTIIMIITKLDEKGIPTEQIINIKRGIKTWKQKQH